MPCYDSRSRCESPDKELAERLNRATRAACDLRTILRRGGKESDLAGSTRSWIAEHDKWDRERIAQEEALGVREKARRDALAKLDLDERRVLGL
jgi:hypothetical protein